jgi:hypothetical protein
MLFSNMGTRLIHIDGDRLPNTPFGPVLDDPPRLSYKLDSNDEFREYNNPQHIVSFSALDISRSKIHRLRTECRRLSKGIKIF